jgi:hypothetical protein
VRKRPTTDRQIFFIGCVVEKQLITTTASAGFAAIGAGRSFAVALKTHFRFFYGSCRQAISVSASLFFWYSFTGVQDKTSKGRTETKTANPVRLFLSVEFIAS